MRLIHDMMQMDRREAMIWGAGALCFGFALAGLTAFPPELRGHALSALVVFVGLGGSLVLDNARGGSLIRLGRKKAELTDMEMGLQAIQESDPSFCVHDFCGHVATAYLKLNRAIDDQQIEHLQAFLSDGVYQRLVFRQDEEKLNGRVRQTLRTTIEHLVPVEIHSAKNTKNSFEVVSVLIRGTAVRQYRQGQNDASEVSEPISEVWTFLRRRGAKSKSEEFGLVSGKCPNCGTDVTVNQWERCPSCESTLRSGEHDWVLSKISDHAAWKKRTRFRLTSAMRYWIKQDPGFSTHYLEDRASVIFFRQVLADRLGRIDPLGKVATDRFCKAYGKRLASSVESRTIYLEPQILTADVAGVIAEEPFDRALMHIRWTARRATLSPGQTQPTPGGRVHMRTMMVLARKHGVRTRIERTISSSHCPKCGAPESNNASHACDFCGIVLNDGAFEWTLADLLPYTSTAAMALRKKAHEGIEVSVAVLPVPQQDDSPGQRVIVMDQKLPEFSRNELEGVQVNGSAPEVSVREDDTTLCLLLLEVAQAQPVSRGKLRDFIRRVAKSLQIPDEQLRKAVNARRPMDAARLRQIGSENRNRWLTALVDVALIDQQIEPWEEAFILAAAERLGLCRYDVEQVIRVRLLEWEAWMEGMRSADMFAWVVSLAAADGHLHPKEMDHLKRLAARYEISEDQLNTMCHEALEGQLDVPAPENAKAGQFWFRQMIDTALADGTIAPGERRLLAKVGDALGLTRYDVQQSIRRRQAALYKEAREQFRNGPKAPKEQPLHLKVGWDEP